jgi:hypothetical protein
VEAEQVEAKKKEDILSKEVRVSDTFFSRTEKVVPVKQKSAHDKV